MRVLGKLLEKKQPGHNIWQPAPLLSARIHNFKKNQFITAIASVKRFTTPSSQSSLSWSFCHPVLIAASNPRLNLTPASPHTHLPDSRFSKTSSVIAPSVFHEPCRLLNINASRFCLKRCVGPVVGSNVCSRSSSIAFLEFQNFIWGYLNQDSWAYANQGGTQS